ncbi:MAG TPA: NYN domain-containing protein [bacterium]|nr:NYN domain-containing protein [bacterium]HPR86947.1 NYN domain-containing protein [bacterium]
MHIIVDGYNVLLRGYHRSRVAAAELEQQREAVIRKHAGYAASRSIRITLVFDGQEGVGPSAGSTGGKVKVLFSRPPENADAMIKRLAQTQKQPRDVVVVTSDQPLARFVRSCGCQVLSSEAWRQKLEQGRDEDLQEKHGGVNDLDLDAWMQLFGEN